MKVITGLEVLLTKKKKRLKDKNIGLLAHQASVDSRLNHALELLRYQCGPRVKQLFGPEHGFFGAAQDMESVKNSVEPSSGLPLISLYGRSAASLKPLPEHLSKMDMLIIDLQDIGSRYYTYCQTMVHVLEAAGNSRTDILVLDRPNPLNGFNLEGSTVQKGFASFVGLEGMAARHGLTIGEIAHMVNKEYGIHARLEVMRMEGWKRSMWFDQTGLPWIFPSPNMPTLTTALVYPGACLWEGTNLSEGRGTTRPFEIVGAPYLDPFQFSRALNDLNLPGVRFRPLFFKPTFQKWAGKSCGGTQLHIVDRSRFRPFLTGVAVIKIAREQGGNRFSWRHAPYEFERNIPAIDLLSGSNVLRTALENGQDFRSIRNHMQKGLALFRSIRKKHLLYE